MQIDSGFTSAGLLRPPMTARPAPHRTEPVRFSGAKDVPASVRQVADIDGLKVMELTHSPVSQEYREAVLAAVRALPIQARIQMKMENQAIVLCGKLVDSNITGMRSQARVACYDPTSRNIYLPQQETYRQPNTSSNSLLQNPFKLFTSHEWKVETPIHEIGDIVRHEVGHAMAHHISGKDFSQAPEAVKAYQEDLGNLTLTQGEQVPHFVPVTHGGEFTNIARARGEAFAEVWASLLPEGGQIDAWQIQTYFPKLTRWVAKNFFEPYRMTPVLHIPEEDSP